MNDFEDKATLHEYILEKMKELGEVSATTFAQVMENEPTLMTRYVRASGIRAIDARIVDMEGDEVTLLITLEQHVQRVGKICFIG